MCGIAGAFNVPNASYVVNLMLKAIQHRGQEAAGIVSAHDGELYEIRDKGLVDEVFGGVDFDQRLPGLTAIGHVRYSTAGDGGSTRGIQPLSANLRRSQVAIAHNGNLTDYAERRAELETNGAVFASKSDTELFLHFLARSREQDFGSSMLSALQEAHGAWSILVLTPETLYAAVDPSGYRPLVMATYNGGTVFASETCAFDLLGITRWQMVDRATVITMLSDNKHRIDRLPAPDDSSHCIFEHVYFTRPDSNAFGMSSNAVRERIGMSLAARETVAFDVVTSVPDSSNAFAVAFAEALKVPFRHALIRNHYTGRTFITPQQKAREFGVRMKLNVVKNLVKGKIVGVDDDSIVRGTTSRKVIQLLRDAGAKEVHLRVGSPPVIHPCYWGIDTPHRRELIAAKMDSSLLAAELGADSLVYATIEDLRQAVNDLNGSRYCTTCFTGVLPGQRLIPPELLVRIPP